MSGETYMGIERSTFVIDADGNLARVMLRVKPDEHADDVLAALRPDPRYFVFGALANYLSPGCPMIIFEHEVVDLNDPGDDADLRPVAEVLGQPVRAAHVPEA